MSFVAPNGKFLKDKWILDAIAAGYILPQEDGTIYRRKWASQDGKRLSAEAAPIKYRVHPPSGRVYYQMSWKGFTKSVLVNRVIALKFLPNPLNLPVVNHIDGNKEHNYLRQPTPELIAKWGEYQLEWSTGHDNEKHAHRTGLKTGRGSQNANAKLSAGEILRIRERYAAGEKPYELAQIYGVARSTIINIVRRMTWTHI